MHTLVFRPPFPSLLVYFPSLTGGKKVHISFWTCVSLAADTAIINTEWQISMDPVWKERQTFWLPFDLLFLSPLLLFFSALLRIQMLFRPWLLPDLLRRSQGESKLEVQSLGEGIRCAGGAAHWGDLPASHARCPGSLPSLALTSSGKTEITKPQRQSWQEKAIKTPLSGVEIITGIGRRLRYVNGKNMGRLHVFRYILTFK